MTHKLNTIMKLNTIELKKANWRLNTSKKTKREHPDWYIRIGESQLTRWIQELTNKHDDYIPELVSIVMDNKKDYDKANKGFKIDGIKYRRLLGTNGGVKTSTIFYIDEELYPEIMKRITNGRNMTKELVPAKLEAYQALVCSCSKPVPMPRLIVVHDCMTAFTEDVTMISMEKDAEQPTVEPLDGYQFDHNNSDGCGLMSPDYARRVNKALHGIDEPISAFTARYAWTKGILACFDFVEFAEKVAGTYIIKDVWGNDQDVRNADAIITESMLKLWDSYTDFDDWKRNSDVNRYDFCAAKTAPLELERMRTTNYQFLQGLELSDEEITELCRPTVEMIHDIMGGDVTKSILFLGGSGLSPDNVMKQIEAEDNTSWEALCLMANPHLINDPHIGWLIKHQLEKTIERAAMGTLFLKANYAIIVGDLYALAQSAFGMTVTGLLPAGEIYHAFWRREGAESVACFRAPMICQEQIAKRRISYDDDAAHWFQHCKTIMILSAWDSTAERLSGADFDGDTSYTTDNPVIMDAVKDVRPLLCQQEKAAKKIPTEADIIAANKIAFGDQIGTICNRVTEMFDLMAKYEKGSAEWNTLYYRIQTGQFFVQNQIDAAKGVIPSEMPDRWYKKKSKTITPEDLPLVADKKPYFMIYNYQTLRTKYNKVYQDFSDDADIREFGLNVSDVMRKRHKTPEMLDFLDAFYDDSPVTLGNCLTNRIARHIENEFGKYKAAPQYRNEGDREIYEYGVHVTKSEINQIGELFRDYQEQIAAFKREAEELALSSEVKNDTYNSIDAIFLDLARQVVKDDEHLTDALVEVCYTSEKKKFFAWKLVGRHMFMNVLRKSGNVLNIPVKDENGEIEYRGQRYNMEVMEYGITAE